MSKDKRYHCRGKFLKLVGLIGHQHCDENLIKASQYPGKTSIVLDKEIGIKF